MKAAFAMIIGATLVVAQDDFLSDDARNAVKTDLSAGERETVTKENRYAADDGGDDDFDITAQELKDEGSSEQQSRLAWFNQVSGLPFFEANKQKIWNEATEDLDPLLLVCEKGKLCRQRQRAKLIKKLSQDWYTLIEDIRGQIQDQVEVTKTEIKNTHEEFVVCQKEDECCDTADETIINWWVEINNFTKEKNILKKEKLVLMYKIEEVRMECPEETKDANQLLDF